MERSKRRGICGRAAEEHADAVRLVEEEGVSADPRAGRAGGSGKQTRTVFVPGANQKAQSAVQPDPVITTLEGTKEHNGARGRRRRPEKGQRRTTGRRPHDTPPSTPSPSSEEEGRRKKEKKMRTPSAPAYEGARFDPSGMCVYHPRVRLCRADPSRPGTYRVVRKT
ncbi:hypothetical protein THAOC_03614, partial [Thalassiosira oceanica]